MLFDWLIVGQVLAINPAHAVRGPKHVIRRAQTPVLTEEQAKRLLESIKVVKKVTLPDGSEGEALWLVGLRVEIFLLWRYRIVPYRSYVKGWKVSPSHYVNQDLATIWLDK